MVEFALVSVLLLTLLLGIIEFSHLVFVYVATVNASREGARYGSSVGPGQDGATPRFMDCDGIRQAALRIGAFAGMGPDEITITYDHGPGTGTFATCPPANANAVQLGDRVVVTARAVYRPWVPLFPRVTLPLQSTSARSILRNINVSGGGSVPGYAPPASPPTPTPTFTATATSTPATPTPTNTPSAAPPTPIPASPTPTRTPLSLAPPVLSGEAYHTAGKGNARRCVLDSFTWEYGSNWPGFQSVFYKVTITGTSYNNVLIFPSGSPYTWTLSQEIPRRTHFQVSAYAVLTLPDSSKVSTQTGTQCYYCSVTGTLSRESCP